MQNLTPVAEVVADIIEKMSEADKANVSIRRKRICFSFIMAGVPVSEITTIYGGIKHW